MPRISFDILASLRYTECMIDSLQKTLVLDLSGIKGDTEVGPYWDGRCADVQSGLFLPHKNSDGHMNYRETAASFWKRAWQPLQETNELLFSVPEANSGSGVEDNACKKIRIYPEQPELVDQQIDASRRAYNLCVAIYRDWKKGDKPVDFTQLRRSVREMVRDESAENGWPFLSSSIDEACQEAKRANQAVIRNRTAGWSSELRFRKKTDTRQGFVYQKLAQAGLPGVLGNVHMTEEIPNEALTKQARLLREYGRYFLITKHSILLAEAKIHGRAIGLDPGVRTFVTTYAPDGVAKLGENFAWDQLRPLGLQLDKLYSQRQHLFNAWKTLPSQFCEDMLRHYTKRIYKLRQRRQDLIADLHNRICYWFVTNYDFIFLPTFESGKLSRKQTRKIGSKTVRGMMDLCHHKFRRKLAWMCRKYGKTLIAVNEAYTTRTQSWDGKQQAALKRASYITDGNIRMDRDTNGARGIFLRAITRQLAP